MLHHKRHARFLSGLLAAGCCLLATGCSPASVALGTGASLGVAAEQEGGVTGAVKDDATQLKIVDAYIKNDFKLFRDLSVTVKEGRVLLTGSVPTPDMRVEAVRLAWQAPDVKQVLNEISVSQGEGITGSLVDGWITGNIKTRLMFDKYIQSINYNVDTVDGNVYVMGVAQNQSELDRVLAYARSTNHVRNVISYVRLKYQDPNSISGNNG
ncbi:MAG: BON domain-containing protein [Alphaproteobacteria bacterium]|nr:BON domain-containing protein [Alphaproteobacteria bacterium]MDE2336943.1 BON domain-containing protein [Alphaproteobacteria bacterium]